MSRCPEILHRHAPDISLYNERCGGGTDVILQLTGQSRSANRAAGRHVTLMSQLTVDECVLGFGLRKQDDRGLRPECPGLGASRKSRVTVRK